MVAPSFVTDSLEVDPGDGCKILSIPFGPSDDLTTSAIASAPMMVDWRVRAAGQGEPQAARAQARVSRHAQDGPRPHERGGAARSAGHPNPPLARSALVTTVAAAALARARAHAIA